MGPMPMRITVRNTRLAVEECPVDLGPVEFLEDRHLRAVRQLRKTEELHARTVVIIAEVRMRPVHAAINDTNNYVLPVQ